MCPGSKIFAFAAMACAAALTCSSAPAEGLGDDALAAPTMRTVSGDDNAEPAIAPETGGKFPKDDADYWCDCPSTKWGVRAGALALFRESPDSAVLFVNPLDTTENLDAADFDFGYKAGYELSVMRRLQRWPDVEFRYMGCDAWTARAGTSTTTAAPLAINAQIPVFLPTGRDITAVYASDLDSFELNLRTDRWLDCVTLLVGFRYLELDEAFQADLVDAVTPAPTVRLDTTTQNRLYGVQVGVEVMLCEWRRFSLDFVGKAGLYHNSGAQTTVLDSGVITVPALGEADRASFLGEAHLAAVYCLRENLALRASYGVMGISDLALATDQIDQLNFFTGTGISAGGDAFYHGGFLGIEFGY
jgi:hypothetical protein